MSRIFVALILSLSMVSAADAAIFTVTSTSSTGPGSLREAITALNAASGNTHAIEIDLPGESPKIVLSTPLPQINKPAVGIRSIGSARVAISGNEQHPVLVLSSSVTLFTMTDLELQNGYATNGACLYSPASIMILTRVRFWRCKALREGGAAFSRNTTTINDSEFVENLVRGSEWTTSLGGAISHAGQGNLVLNDVLFESNWAFSTLQSSLARGGAVALASSNGANRCLRCRFIGNMTMQRSTDVLEASTFQGGAVSLLDGSLSIDRSVFSDNYAQTFGGAVDAYTFGMLTITNSTFDRNQAAEGGGAIFDSGRSAKTRIVNTVFNSNGSARFSNDLYAASHILLSGGSSLELHNSAFGATSSPGFIPSPPRHCHVRNGAVATITATDNLRIAGTDNCGLGATVVESLRLGSKQKGASGVERYQLLADSPLLDAGSALAPANTGSACMPSDLDGTARATDSNGDGVARCSVGPFETSSERSLYAHDFETY
jgi:hypothetical protein